ncbi:hypothetical protein HMI55_002502 [Coelomomyces lativittatus]|nr:hypothetical protein HMI56_004481 [Coelomomyces lativittatus]KAJ1503325.1 hypothetical protein HMI55_002502 [Coelomomyces lativittatus]
MYIEPSLVVSQFLKEIQKSHHLTSITSKGDNPSTSSTSSLSSSLPSRHPWMCSDHPMLLDDYQTFPPFVLPHLLVTNESSSTTVTHIHDGNEHTPNTAAALLSSFLRPATPVTYEMLSVLRRRRVKMNKHKLRKLRKRTRAQRK